jgi:YD repeat-containing protein
MKRLLLIIFLANTFISLNAAEAESKIIEVIQIGKHYDNNFLNLKESSKKVYYFNPNGLVSRIAKYGRYHYAYLKVIGRITNYQYLNGLVIEIDSSYCCEDDENINISIDTLDLEFITKKLLYDSKYNIYDNDEKLIQSSNDFSEVKKYEYDENGLISKIIYYYSDSDDNLEKTNHLIFRWKNDKGLSKETIERLNNLILWQHEFEV